MNGGGLAAADPALAPDGVVQAQAAAEVLLASGFAGAQVVSSPALRSLMTAEVCALALGGPHACEVMVEPLLAEVDFGGWEGRRPQDLHEESPDLVGQWWSDPDVAPPRGESARAASARHNAVLDFWLDAAQDPRIAVGAGEDPRAVVLVGHASTVRSVIGRALGADHEHMSRVSVEPGAVAVVRLWADGGGCLDSVAQPAR